LNLFHVWKLNIEQRKKLLYYLEKKNISKEKFGDSAWKVPVFHQSHFPNEKSLNAQVMSFLLILPDELRIKPLWSKMRSKFHEILDELVLTFETRLKNKDEKIFMLCAGMLSLESSV